MKEGILISIKASEDVVKELSAMEFENVLMTEPINLSSPSDVLDAPLNPDDIINGVEVVKVMFQAGTAILAFCTAFINLLKEKNAKAKMTTKEGQKEVDGNTKPEDLNKLISK